MVVPARLRVVLAVALLAVAFLFTKAVYSDSSSLLHVPNSRTSSTSKVAISYDRSTPPSIGCEEKVTELQLGVIEAFSRELKGIRYANIWGYLGPTENKGDAAIWIAQDMLLATLGIEKMEVCRYINQCNVTQFRAALAKYRPHSAVIMAGGGNFNDYYHDAHPARLEMTKMFKEYPIRAFPQSINMTKPDMIKQTAEVFGGADNVQLAARDKPSFDFLQDTFGDNAPLAVPNKVRHVLTPDIAFMFGNRGDIRLNTKKTHQVYILTRDDKEWIDEAVRNFPIGEGHFDFGGAAGKVSYLKNDWRQIITPTLADDEFVGDNGEKVTYKEGGRSQRTWLRAMYGFEMLASAEFVITDRLHGHIMCTIMGIPHVLMDSKLKKNFFFHDTWTKDCACTRVASNFEEAKNFAKMYFEKQAREKKN